jgi:stearoyl-CoA desaturase (delta-9 desaturase)
MGYWIACAAVFIAAYLLNITYITVFYHRGLTHQAVKLSPWARKLVVATGNWVTGLDPKGWSAMHRLHHVYSDTQKDPHSPRYYGIFGLMLQQLYSYNGILRKLNKGDPEVTRVVSDLDFPVSWLNRKKLWALPYVLHVAVWLGLGFGLDMWMLGYCYFLGMMSHPIQGWMVNAFGHSHGYRNFQTGDDSRNNTLVAWLVFGEGYQNNHHRYPKAAKFSIKWFEVDPGYALCLGLQAIGALEIQGAKAKEPVEVEAGAVVASY